MKEIRKLENEITWYITYDSPNGENAICVRASDKKEALCRMKKRMDCPFTILSISAI